VERYAYGVYGSAVIRDTHGEILNASSVGSPYFFTGRRLDAETRLYYYRARYYSPTLGRFLQTDPIGYEGGINLYSYCRNNPVILVDASGLCGERGFTRALLDYGFGWAENALKFRQWITGTGPVHTSYHDNTPQVRNMMSSPGVREARAEFFEMQKGLSVDKPLRPLRAYLYDFRDAHAVVDAGLNPTRQFVGSYYVDIIPNEAEFTKTVILRNRTSMQSFLYGEGPAYDRSILGPGGNVWQEYTWTEPLLVGLESGE
jgi:RHS repeat-associated protein